MRLFFFLCKVKVHNIFCEGHLSVAGCFLLFTFIFKVNPAVTCQTFFFLQSGSIEESSRWCWLPPCFPLLLQFLMRTIHITWNLQKSLGLVPDLSTVTFRSCAHLNLSGQTEAKRDLDVIRRALLTRSHCARRSFGLVARRRRFGNKWDQGWWGRASKTSLGPEPNTPLRVAAVNDYSPPDELTPLTQARCQPLIKAQDSWHTVCLHWLIQEGKTCRRRMGTIGDAPVRNHEREYLQGWLKLIKCVMMEEEVTAALTPESLLCP